MGRARVHRSSRDIEVSGHFGGRAYRGDLTPAIARKDGPRSNPRSVPCLTCAAAPTQPCVSAGGTPAKTQHVSRRRMAIRRQNLEREAAAAALAPLEAEEEVFGQGRGPAVRCPGCSSLFHGVKAGLLGESADVDELVIPAHVPGGGRYSSRRGDALCAGAFESVDKPS
jgi:hypothetical protein